MDAKTANQITLGYTYNKIIEQVNDSNNNNFYINISFSIDTPVIDKLIDDGYTVSDLKHAGYGEMYRTIYWK